MGEADGGGTGRTGSARAVVAIPVALAGTVGAAWLVGIALDSGLVRFAAVMLAAGTFLPLPADTFALVAAADHPAVAVGIVGGAANAAAVVVERQWVLAVIHRPSFDRVRATVGRNRLVRLTERNLFLALVVAGLTFVPFEPFRMVAVLARYPVGRYVAATALSRGLRYYLLAVAGSALADLGLLRQAVAVSLVVFVVGLGRAAGRMVAARRRGRPEEAGDG